MVSDAELSEDRDLRIDGTGDFGTVTGNDNIEQQHVNALFIAAQKTRLGDTKEENAKRRLFDAIENELNRLEYVDEIVDLNIIRENKKTFTVNVLTDVIDNPIERVVNS
jgi:hypothetical protein